MHFINESSSGRETTCSPGLGATAPEDTVLLINVKGVRGMAQLAECLPSTHEVLGSILGAA